MVVRGEAARDRYDGHWRRVAMWGVRYAMIGLLRRDGIGDGRGYEGGARRCEVVHGSVLMSGLEHTVDCLR